MTDEEIVDTWMTLDPAPDERRRINTQVSAWLEAHDTSMAAEWLCSSGPRLPPSACQPRAPLQLSSRRQSCGWHVC